MKKHIIPIIFFITFLFSGLLIYKDFGIAWDEPHQRTLGIYATNYLLHGEPEYLQYQDKYYGSIFEIALIFGERAFKITDNIQKIYQLRHLLIFLSFFVGSIFFYLLSKQRFKSWKLALITTAMLVINPRIFAHSFFNSKDIPFLAVSIIGVYALTKFLENKKSLYLVFLAISTAMLIALRITGIYLLILSIIFITIDYLSKKQPKQLISNLSLFIILSSSLTILFWPILWTNPINNFLLALEKMSHYPWENSVLYFGQHINASDLPWHYLPVWIAISTPLAYLFLFTLGLGSSLKKIFLALTKYYQSHRSDLIFLFIIFGPILTIILLNSTVYDEWRQIFFIYPFIILIAGKGIQLLSKKIILKYLVYFALLISFTGSIKFMYNNYPFFNVYFNQLAKPEMFELDYWGVAYKQGLEFIVDHDQKDKIKIATANFPGTTNINMLSIDQRKRLIFTPSIKDADYYITNYRWDEADLSSFTKHKEIIIEGVPIIGIYKL